MHKKYLKIALGIVIIFVVGSAVFFIVNKSSARKVSITTEVETKTATTPQGKPADISKIPILTYHSFGPKPDFKENKTQLQYRVTIPMFEAQMKYLAEQGYKTITFADLVENQINGKPVPDHAIVLTFDDGWKNQYEHALPILEKYKFTGTFFIITNSINTKSYMSVDELKDLNSKGFEIASHTKTHPKLVMLDDVQLADELQGSKKSLEEKLGITVTTLAYPYYGHDDRVMKAVQAAGYRGARAGWAKFSNDPTHMFEFKSQEVVNNPNPFAEKRMID